MEFDDGIQNGDVVRLKGQSLVMTVRELIAETTDADDLRQRASRCVHAGDVLCDWYGVGGTKNYSRAYHAEQLELVEPVKAMSVASQSF